jgi:hypothetical protein
MPAKMFPVQAYETRASVLLERAREVLDDYGDDYDGEIKALKRDITYYLTDLARGKT